MLVGPSITLEKLEEHMNDKLYEIRLELPKLEKEFSVLREAFRTTPRVIENDEGKEIMNPEFVDIPNKMEKIERQIEEYQEQQELFEEKLVELSDIEERSVGRGNVDKSKYKINLSLNDCLKLGIVIDETTPEKVVTE